MHFLVKRVVHFGSVEGKGSYLVFDLEQDWRALAPDKPKRPTTGLVPGMRATSAAEVRTAGQTAAETAGPYLIELAVQGKR